MNLEGEGNKNIESSSRADELKRRFEIRRVGDSLLYGLGLEQIHRILSMNSGEMRTRSEFSSRTSLLRRGKNQRVERSQPPPSVLGSCALLDIRPNRQITCLALAIEITTIPAFEKTYARLSATRREFGGLSITHRFRLPIPGAALRITATDRMPDTPFAKALYPTHCCKYIALDLSLLR